MAMLPLVSVVDDDISIRESLDLMIRSAGWMPEVFDSAQAFLSRPADDIPDCMVLDVEMPGIDGFALQERIAADHPEIPIIFLTGHGDIPGTVRAMRAGATGFFTKPFEEEALLEAIRHAIGRSRVACARTADRKILQRRYESLTAREKQVMLLVASGLLNKQVGGRLDITEITVKVHRGRVMKKMQAGSLAHLVRMADSLYPSPGPHA